MKSRLLILWLGLLLGAALAAPTLELAADARPGNEFIFTVGIDNLREGRLTYGATLASSTGLDFGLGVQARYQQLIERTLLIRGNGFATVDSLGAHMLLLNAEVALGNIAYRALLSSRGTNLPLIAFEDARAFAPSPFSAASGFVAGGGYTKRSGELSYSFDARLGLAYEGAYSLWARGGLLWRGLARGSLEGALEAGYGTIAGSLSGAALTLAFESQLNELDLELRGRAGWRNGLGVGGDIELVLQGEAADTNWEVSGALLGFWIDPWNVFNHPYTQLSANLELDQVSQLANLTIEANLATDTENWGGSLGLSATLP